MIRLSDLRKEKGLSQKKLAEEMHVCQSTLSNWESGTTEPSIQQLKEIADHFTVSVDYLIDHSDETGNISVIKQITKEDLQIIETINSLPPTSKDRLLDFIKSLDKDK